MNQDKLEVVKQEMASVNLSILGISEEWVNLSQMYIISTTVGRNPLEEMEKPSPWSLKSTKKKKKKLLLRKHTDWSEFTSYEFLLYVFCYHSMISDYLFLNFLLIIRQELSKLEVQR